jgi:undecaprenyl-diphosphatase
VNGRIVLICALCLGALTALVAGGVAIPGDVSLVQLALNARGEALTGAIQLLAFISSSIPALLITVAVSGVELLCARRLSIGAGWATFAYLGATACNVALRVAVGRQRPSVEYIPHLLPELQLSFQRFSYPSGHAGAALMAYSSLVVLVWEHGPLRRLALAGGLLVMLGVGFGRVYLGVHWPSDVLGGYLLSACWLGIGLEFRSRCESGQSNSS